jgi:hypothetical protein
VVGKVAVTEPVAVGGVELAIGLVDGNDDGRAEPDEMEDEVGWAEDEVDEDGGADEDRD